MDKALNLFYAEPDPDRWFKYDRYPRKLIRRLVRGKPRPGGVMRVALNLMQGLDKLGIPYRLNDYNYIIAHPQEIACIIGKPQVLFNQTWTNPIVFGAGIYSHPIDRPELLKEFPNVKKILVPGEWMRQMFEPFYGAKVVAWPTGIDTDEWQPSLQNKVYDFLIYDKIRWEHDRFSDELIDPMVKILDRHNLSHHQIKYGAYTPAELKDKLSRSKAVIFLCEHETQGLAYQQILSANTPILAWDRGGYWQDPEYYPDRVKYGPVSSVPYWDDRCGKKFTGAADFEETLAGFLADINLFKPRDYVIENLSLEKCASAYLKIVQDTYSTLNNEAIK
ncbi:glycosyltransferase [Mucilaginibacter sp. UR6-11]|uniref:glycosyltransferase n=1 Tax=Mucilaginibacter sp. UR6-11 TaxID=1435644 RepID=UPI001E63E707|nr:glycosyltransferase [Mucilaginibacter sp. UR6-11]MCC8425735.1 glycosyltransferase [Mucilaginibacter sp. UR6-11]